MIRLDDLEAAIAECEGNRDPKADTCIKLAAFYIIRENLYPESIKTPSMPPDLAEGYSYQGSNEKPSDGLIRAHSGTEFSKAADGLPMDAFMDILDELMDAVHVLQPRLYDGALRKIRSLAR